MARQRVNGWYVSPNTARPYEGDDSHATVFGCDDGVWFIVNTNTVVPEEDLPAEPAKMQRLVMAKKKRYRPRRRKNNV